MMRPQCSVPLFGRQKLIIPFFQWNVQASEQSIFRQGHSVYLCLLRSGHVRQRLRSREGLLGSITGRTQMEAEAWVQIHHQLNLNIHFIASCNSSLQTIEKTAEGEFYDRTTLSALLCNKIQRPNV